MLATIRRRAIDLGRSLDRRTRREQVVIESRPDWFAPDFSENDTRDHLVTASLAAAAAVAWMLVPPASGPADPAPRTVRIHQTESTLLAERTLAVEEHDGRLWELVEQEWRDDSIAVCSSSPVRVRYSESRVGWMQCSMTTICRRTFKSWSVR